MKKKPAVVVCGVLLLTLLAACQNGIESEAPSMANSATSMASLSQSSLPASSTSVSAPQSGALPYQDEPDMRKLYLLTEALPQGAPYTPDANDGAMADFGRIF